MLKQLSQLEHVIGERVYHFICDPNSPLNDAKEALFQFQKYIGQIEDSVKEQIAQQAASKAPVADVAVPPVEASKVEPIDQPKE